MDTLTRSELDTKLKDLGYESISELIFDSCTHPSTEPWAVYTMPCAESMETPVEHYGDLGWSRYVGCQHCCLDLGGHLFCGGAYKHARIFRGEADVTEELTNMSIRALQSAHDEIEVED
jgi:hypothetical protein